MDNTSPKQYESGSCASAANTKTYSAQELGELMNKYPRKLLELNIGFITRWYDCVFIEDVLRCLEHERDLHMLVELIMIRWTCDVDERNEHVSRLNPEKKLWEPLHPTFPDVLKDIEQRVLTYRENKKKQARFEDKWRRTYSRSNDDITYHLADLPETVREQLRIVDDWLFSDFAELMLGPVKEWVDRHHKSVWGVVRFICQLKGIVKRDSTIADFNRLLMELGLGDHTHNIKYREDAKNKNNFSKYLHSTPEHPDATIALLKKEGQELELILEQVLCHIVPEPLP